jgi:hypothetical protein
MQNPVFEFLRFNYLTPTNMSQPPDHTFDALLVAVRLGSPDAIRETIRTLPALPEGHPLKALACDSWSPAEWAAEIGHSLRETGYPRAVVNEFYRASFYRSDEAFALASNPWFALFLANKAVAPLDKWIHYFSIYERHFAAFRNSTPRILEIGVYRGGGLHLLFNYFNPGTYLVGIDIDDSALRACHGRFAVEIGDQSDPDFLASVIAKHGPFDIVIDDGGHTMRQQITSFEVLFEHVNPGGIYLVEDCHTSYWNEYQDHPTTFVEFAKARIDDINAYHRESADALPRWTNLMDGAHFYDSIVAFDRNDRRPPFCEISGLGEALSSTREQQVDRGHLYTLVNGLELDAKLARGRVQEQDLEKDALVREQTRLLAAIGHLEEARDTLRSDKEKLETSRSWRITRPLRWLTSR